MSQRLSIEVKGNNHIWSFDIFVDPKYLQEWRDDGLVVNEVYNKIPGWVVNWNLIKIWIFFEDLFFFRNSFKG